MSSKKLGTNQIKVGNHPDREIPLWRWKNEGNRIERANIKYGSGRRILLLEEYYNKNKERNALVLIHSIIVDGFIFRWVWSEHIFRPKCIMSSYHRVVRDSFQNLLMVFSPGDFVELLMVFNQKESVEPLASKEYITKFLVTLLWDGNNLIIEQLFT